MNKKTLVTVCLLISLTGCSSNKEKKLLPDAGPTTVELIRGTRSGANYYGNGVMANYRGQELVDGYSPASSYTNSHVKELRRDFKRVPNPDIIGYVYPHINNNEMPIPGYFTIFKLYSRDHFALTTEGYHVQ